MDISTLLGTINDVWGSGQIVDKYGVAVKVRYDQYRGNFVVNITDGLQLTQHPISVYYQSSIGSLVEQFNTAIKTAIDNHKSLVYKETMTSEEVPLFTEAVVGYRRWILADWVLEPTNYGNPWRPGVNTAKCQPESHRQLRNQLMTVTDRLGHSDAPAEGCNCGLNAFFNPQAWIDGGVSGAIVGWGRMQVHPDGFRAQYAQIVGLLNAPTEIMGIYGVESFEDIESLQVHASQFGSPLPESLRPKEQKAELAPVLSSYATTGYTTTNTGYTSISYPNPFFTPHNYSTVGTLPSPGSSRRYEEAKKRYEERLKEEADRESRKKRRWRSPP